MIPKIVCSFKNQYLHNTSFYSHEKASLKKVKVLGVNTNSSWPTLMGSI